MGTVRKSHTYPPATGVVTDTAIRNQQHLVAPKPSRDEDLTLPHLLVVGPTAPAPVNLLYEGDQLLNPQPPLFFQVEKLGVGVG